MVPDITGGLSSLCKEEDPLPSQGQGGDGQQMQVVFTDPGDTEYIE